MTEPVLTPSKITAWLDCAHYLTLRSQVDNGTRAAPSLHLQRVRRLVGAQGRARTAVPG